MTRRAIPWQPAPAARAVGPFGQALQREREARDLSQTDLAAACGYDRTYLVRLEQGQRTPSRETVAALAEALDLDDLAAGTLLMAAGYLPARPGWHVRYDPTGGTT